MCETRERIKQYNEYIAFLDEQIADYDTWIEKYPEDWALVFSKSSLVAIKRSKVCKRDKLIEQEGKR